MANESPIFAADEIVRYYPSKKVFNKIPKKSLIPVFYASNGKEDRKELDRMERHFRGEEFLRIHPAKCPECNCRHEVKFGGKLPSVPFCVTRSKIMKGKPYTRFQIWVERVV